MQSASKPLEAWAVAQAWREVTDVPIEDPPFVAASAYVAALAYPENTESRNRLIECLVESTKARSGTTPSIRRRDTDRARDRATRLINVRLRAAHLAARVLVERASENTVIGIESARSIREAIANEHAPTIVSIPRSGAGTRPRPDPDEVDTNVFRDVWTPSLPVMAMAIALKSCLRALDNSEPALDDLIYRPAWVTNALRQTVTVAYSLTLYEIAATDTQIVLRRA